MTLELSDNVKDFLKYVLVLVLCAVFVWGYYQLTVRTTVFAADVSQDATFHVDLLKDKNYELWVLDLNGPETVDISINNGPYAPYWGTFRLMHPEGDYLPYHPGFSVKEDGTYDINVHPLDQGTVRVAIQQKR
jgi:hypothetical protein